jgi:hypothetical protein
VHKVIKNKDYNLGPVVRHLQVKEFDIPYQLGDVTAGGSLETFLLSFDNLSTGLYLLIFSITFPISAILKL